MGNAFLTNVEDSFKAVDEGHKDVLVLDEILAMKVPGNLVDLRHLGTLYMIDKDKDGNFGLAELLEFAEVCAGRETYYRNNEFMTHTRAYCTLQLYKSVVTKRGKEEFVKWFGKLMSNMSVEEEGDVLFAKAENVRTIHDLLGVELTHGYSADEFIALLHQAAEEENLMSLDAAEQDDNVPVKLIEDWARAFITGFTALMKELAFDPNMDLDVAL